MFQVNETSNPGAPIPHAYLVMYHCIIKHLLQYKEYYKWLTQKGARNIIAITIGTVGKCMSLAIKMRQTHRYYINIRENRTTKPGKKNKIK